MPENLLPWLFAEPLEIFFLRQVITLLSCSKTSSTLLEACILIQNNFAFSEEDKNTAECHLAICLFSAIQ